MNSIMDNNIRLLKRAPRPNARGLTLIEILVVVAILGMIAGIIGISVSGAFSDSGIKAASIQISNIGDSLELYRIRNGRYPSTAEGLSVLTTGKSGSAPIMESIPKDPWDGEYIYVFPGQKNPSKYDLSSKGPNGVAGDDDDISNVKKAE